MMNHFLSDTIKRIKPSASLEAAQKARDLKAAGRNIFSLAAGQPDFPTPGHIKEAAYAAIASDKTGYPPVNGIPELRRHICEKFINDNGLSYTPDQVIVGNGAKQVIFNALACTINPEDEVLIPAPYWVSYPEMVRINRGVPKIVPTRKEDGFKLRGEHLRQAITKKTKWLILNNPNNPSGAVLNKADLQALAEVLEDHPRVGIISDDIYECLRYEDEPFYTIAQASANIKERTLVVNGFSKAYCMTGWRLGYGAGPIELINAMRIFQGQSTGGIMQPAQWAGLAALQGPKDFMAEHLSIYKKRRDAIVKRINEIEGLECRLPQGAFYVYVDCSQLINLDGRKGGRRIETDAQLANYLVNQAGVVTVPGEAFGVSPFLRMSYATSMDVITRACDAIDKALAKL